MGEVVDMKRPTAEEPTTYVEILFYMKSGNVIEIETEDVKIGYEGNTITAISIGPQRPHSVTGRMLLVQSLALDQIEAMVSRVL